MSKIILSSLIFCLATLQMQAQRLTKYAIGKSGCSAYMFCNPGEFEVSKAPDSSVVYTNECIDDSVNYGIICAKLSSPTSNLENAENTLVTYLDFLKKEFNIKQAAGYGKGHRLNNNENTRGIIDYWTDLNKNNWKIKGWTDGNFIAVMYAYKLGELPVNKVELFLNGFRLP